MPVIQKENVENFYDQFGDDQQKIGINIRHLFIINKLKTENLNSHSKVLEIGCGIGTVTELIAKIVTNGKVLSIDISPKSISIAKQRLKDYKNVDFLVSDMSNFSNNEKFDFIVFPDVLEHIPIDQHFDLFKKIRNIVSEECTICINIPHANYINWCRKNHPESLQIIDQPLDISVLTSIIYEIGFKLEQLTSYKLHHNQNDYQFMIFKNFFPEEFTNKSKPEIILNKLKLRLK